MILCETDGSEAQNHEFVCGWELMAYVQYFQFPLADDELLVFLINM
jgi:hypothetical protein